MNYNIDDLHRYQQLYEQEKKRLEIEEKALKDAKTKRQFAERVSETEDILEIERLKNEEILQLQKNGSSLYLASLRDLANQEKEILSALKNEVTDIYKGIAETAEGSIEKVLKSKQKLEEKLSDHKSNKLLHYNVYGGGVNGGVLAFDKLNDFSNSNLELMEYYNAIRAVKNRIKDNGFDTSVSTDFLSALSEMSVSEGTRFSNAVLNSTDKDFKNAINGFLQNKLLTEKISSELFSDSFEKAIDDTASYMKSELSRMGFEIPEDFTVSGTISAENFGTAFVAKLDDYLENIRDMISQFNAGLATPSYVFENNTAKGNNSSPVTYNQHFTIGSWKESTFEQITAWQNAIHKSKLRGQ